MDYQKIVELVDHVFQNSEINQIRSEILSLLNYLSQYEIKTFLEIGTEKGGTLWLFSSFMPEDSLSISVDIMPPRTLPINGRNIRLIAGNSRDYQTFLQVQEVIKEEKIDLLFIDGQHTEVEKDFLMYSPLVRSGGLVVFHDINPLGPTHNVGTVPFFWESIKEHYKHAEFIENNPEGFGIGVLHIP